MIAWILALAVAAAQTAGGEVGVAQGAEAPVRPDAAALYAVEEAPPEPIQLKVIPPAASFDFAATPGVTTLPMFLDQPAWMALGFRFTAGKNLGPHRVGGSVGLLLEGPIALQWTNNVELGFAWDYVAKSGLTVGASVGPDLMVVTELAEGRSGVQSRFAPAPFLAARVGWSQPHNVLMRRIFVAVEPRFRWVEGEPQVGAVIVVGAGRSL
jgi:hypothetical protein